MFWPLPPFLANDIFGQSNFGQSVFGQSMLCVLVVCWLCVCVLCVCVVLCVLWSVECVCCVCCVCVMECGVCVLCVLCFVRSLHPPPDHPPRDTTLRRTAQNFALFSLSRFIFALLVSLSLGVFSLNSGGVLKRQDP